MTPEQKTDLVKRIAFSIQSADGFKELVETNVSFLVDHANKVVKSENPKLHKHIEGLVESFLSNDKAQQKQSLIWGFVDALEAMIKSGLEPPLPVKPPETIPAK